MPVSLDLPVEIQCIGSGNLIWTSPSREIDDSNALDMSIVLYQEHDPMSNIKTLFIKFFSSDDIGRYTCSVNDSTVNGSVYEASVYISDCEFTVE
jgi:hypothetical protein